jgi:hypothetical protein
MKVATVSIGGTRRVGKITFDATAVVPFDLPAFEANDGILALIRRDGANLPLTLSLLLQAQARELADKIRGAKTVTLHRCGHWTPIKKVKECGTLLSDFLRGIPI